MMCVGMDRLRPRGRAAEPIRARARARNFAAYPLPLARVCMAERTQASNSSGANGFKR